MERSEIGYRLLPYSATRIGNSHRLLRTRRKYEGGGGNKWLEKSKSIAIRLRWNAPDEERRERLKLRNDILARRNLCLHYDAESLKVSNGFERCCFVALSTWTIEKGGMVLRMGEGIRLIRCNTSSEPHRSVKRHQN